MTMPARDYAHLMREAIKLARRGRFRTYPNPAVGAILERDGQILAGGYHHEAGGPHAEVECLNDAREKGVDPCGATMAVTLEPCRHYGKTPPCVNALREAGISRVVYGAKDPNPDACGGAKILEDSGVEVIGPVLERECLDLIADFMVWQTARRPYIMLKLASTLDGRIATRLGHSRWISNETSRRESHALRAGIGRCGGAILVGGGTFRSDNPSLDARIEGAEKQPLACVLTSRLPLPDAACNLLLHRAQQTVFFSTPAAAASTTAEELRAIGCRVIGIGQTREREPDFATMFTIIREDLGCPYVLCEGGGKLALTLVETGYMDEFHLFMAPLILGDAEAKPLFYGRAPLSLEEALRLRICAASLCDGDAHLLLRPKLEVTPENEA